MSRAAAFSLMRQTLDAFAENIEPTPAPPLPIFGTTQPYGLTSRELDVLRLVAMGRSDREIADTLFISHGTARTHVRRARGAAGVLGDDSYGDGVRAALSRMELRLGEGGAQDWGPAPL